MIEAVLEELVGIPFLGGGQQRGPVFGAEQAKLLRQKLLAMPLAPDDKAAAREQAGRYGLGLEITDLGRHEPCPMDSEIQQAMAAACDELGLTHVSLASGAGHDGQSLAALCPVGMLFVPSVDGASHSPRELTEWHDCVNGANALLQTVLNLAG